LNAGKSARITFHSNAMRLLFLCSRNQWRSPTAEAVYQNDPRVEVRSAGVSASARRKVTQKLLLWADVVLVMEPEHKRRVREEFSGIADDLRIEVLDIPDDYEFMDPELVSLIRERTEPWIECESDRGS
jgi:predicted protein tyrosine phosphatase